MQPSIAVQAPVGASKPEPEGPVQTCAPDPESHAHNSNRVVTPVAPEEEKKNDSADDSSMHDDSVDDSPMSESSGSPCDSEEEDGSPHTQPDEVPPNDDALDIKKQVHSNRIFNASRTDGTVVQIRHDDAAGST
jgi:hypothetical protein